MERAKDFHRRLEARQHHVFGLHDPCRRCKDELKLRNGRQSKLSSAASCRRPDERGVCALRTETPQNLSRRAPRILCQRRIEVVPQRRCCGWQRDVWSSRCLQNLVRLHADVFITVRVKLRIYVQEMRVPLTIFTFRQRFFVILVCVRLRMTVAARCVHWGGATTRAHRRAATSHGTSAVSVVSLGTGGSAPSMSTARLDNRFVKTKQTRRTTKALVLNEFVELLKLDACKV
mmetsp:Transcript_37808/g.100602  ORF Transcript_37808/g.100602 Transcript_37808/m.100602 type:complete len:232 (-) Transcript_37808:702-1397(-)